MKTTRRSILSLIFGAAAAPAAVAMAKAMPELPSPGRRYSTVLRVRVPKDYQFVDRSSLLSDNERMVTIEDYVRMLYQPNPLLDQMTGVDD